MVNVVLAQAYKYKLVDVAVVGGGTCGDEEWHSPNGNAVRGSGGTSDDVSGVCNGSGSDGGDLCRVVAYKLVHHVRCVSKQYFFFYPPLKIIPDPLFLVLGCLRF